MWQMCSPASSARRMLPLPSGYQGSRIESWPKHTFMPARSSSATRVRPRRFGNVSKRPCRWMLSVGHEMKLICERFSKRNSFEQYALSYEPIAVVWLAVTRAPIPRTRASSASTSRKREFGSSVSSQCTSTRQPLRSARSIRNRIELTPCSRVFSKCGMPPTTSAPTSIARSISARPPSNDSMPSCGNATICRSISPRASSFTSSIAFSAASEGSVTSTCVRTC